MTFTHVGESSPPDWLSYVLIAVLFASPVIVGLVWRLVDRRRDARRGSAPARQPARSAKPRSIKRTCQWIGALLLLGCASLLAIGLGDGSLGIVLLIGCYGLGLGVFGVGTSR